MQPECGSVFELELNERVLPTPRDGEVQVIQGKFSPGDVGLADPA